jgi:hypothetical protein
LTQIAASLLRRKRREGPGAAVIAMQQFLVSRSLDDLAGDGEQIGR